MGNWKCFIKKIKQFIQSVCRAFSQPPGPLGAAGLLSTEHHRLPVLGFQGSSTKEYFLQRTLQSLERYFYLIAFNYYLHEQVKSTRTTPKTPSLPSLFHPRGTTGGQALPPLSFPSGFSRRGGGQGDGSEPRLMVHPPRPPAGSTPWALPSASAGGCAGTRSCTGCRRT